MGKGEGVSETAEKIAQMTIGSTRQQHQRIYIPPPVKAGMRNGRSDLFSGKSRDMQPGRGYCSKVAG